MTAQDLRKFFLDFFLQKGHKIIPSASLIPQTEVELAGTQKVLFTTAGMHPLIPYLLGEEHPEGKRLANVQKCLRTDDIEEIGDAWHNTFFEMLGNWSFGDYWKTEAISWSYEFITKELNIPTEKLWVTVFAGDDNSPKDEESVNIWKSLGLSKERILSLPKRNNWWGPVGETGPCGPDTEIFVDTTGKSHGLDCQPGDNCGRFSEIWNDVFMEYEKQKDGTYKPSKQKNVDTGMGLERILAAICRKDNVYDTELFEEAMHRIKTKSTKFEPRKARIIADHLRAATFLIADGVAPISADDRGSVLVRLITNAISKGREIGIEGSFASYITDSFIDVYKEQYPELRSNRSRINNTISQEEQRYQFKALSGIALKLEEKQFRTAVEQPGGTFVSNASNTSGTDLTFEELREKFQIPISTPTVSAAIGTVFGVLKTTYGIPPEESMKTAERLLQNWGEPFNLEEAKRGLDVIMELHKEVSKQKGAKKFIGGLAEHTQAAIAGHTATHLLHQALRDVLGGHIRQTGSNITSQRIRFDFAHTEKLTQNQIKKVEEIVNQKISQDLLVTNRLMSLQAAQKIGAIGLFGEKYGEQVSVYFIGDPSKDSGQAYSREFCGGPHVKSTKALGRFKIVKEENIGAGKRRIYAQLESSK